MIFKNWRKKTLSPLFETDGCDAVAEIEITSQPSASDYTMMYTDDKLIVYNLHWRASTHHTDHVQ